jgi:TPR repeat protein
MASRRTGAFVLFGCFVLALVALALYRQHVQIPSAESSVTSTSQSPQIVYSPKRTSGPFRSGPNDTLANLPIGQLIAQAATKDGLAILELAQRAVRCRMLEQASSSGSIDPSEDQSAAKQLADCEKIPVEYSKDPVAWARLAAEAGVVEAQVAYPALASQELTPEVMARDTRRVERYKADSMRFLKRAASAGSVDALNELAHSYQQGVITAADPVLSYAYMSAAERSGLVSSAGRLLSAWGQQLSPEQRSRAGVLSNQIYQECCL